MAPSEKMRDINPRHTWWYRFFMRVPVRCFILPLGRGPFKVKTERYKGEMPSRPFIMVFNHTTDYDFIGTVNGIPEYGRYIISDEIIKKRWKRAVITTATDGIFRRKGENADRVVAAVKETLDQGINVYFAAEGEECHNGVTAPVRRRTGQMIKDMGVDLMTFKMEGGYLMKPKWAKNKSKGHLYGRVAGIYKKEDLAKMTPEEINELIERDFKFNVYDWVKENKIPYDRKDRAEYMEKMLYRCPHCGALYKMHSKKDDFFCEACGYKLTVNEYGLFEGEDVRFDNIYDWDVWQTQCLREESVHWAENPDEVIASDTGCTLIRMHGNATEWMSKGDVNLSITYNEVIIESPKVHMRMPLKDLRGLQSVRNGISLSYNGEYFKVLCLQYPQCMRRYRVIRRIIMGEKYVG